MGGSARAISQAAPRLAKVRFSLLTLLVFVALTCLSLAWWTRPQQFLVEVLFQVSSRQSTLVYGGGLPFDEREYEIFRRSQISLIKSDRVLEAALRDPGIASLSILAAKDDPIAWVSDNLEVESIDGSDILAIRMGGTEGGVEDLRHLVDAVADAYMNEFGFEEKQRQMMQRDAKVRSAAKLRKELEVQLKELQALSEDLRDARQGNAGVKLQQLDVDMLTELWRDLMISIETGDIELNAPPRIRKIQPATVRPK